MSRCSFLYKCCHYRLALLQSDMTVFGSDDLLEIKAILPFKVGRFSNWGVLCRATMNLPMGICHESDFEK